MGPRTMLVVDLESRSIHREELPEKLVLDFLGGRGLGIALLYRRLGKNVDALSPENPLIFTTGPLQCTDFPFSSKTNLATRSPPQEVGHRCALHHRPSSKLDLPLD
jgi:aldehyde:ferredoxin oxidoreductase